MRFVVMSDTHFYVEDKVKHGIFWNRPLPGKVDEIAGCIIDTIKQISPDFIIHCGDFIDRCYKENFDYAKGVMDEINVPWYLAPGNHDTLSTENREEISRLYNLPLGQNYYSKDIGPMHLMFLDTCSWMTDEGKIIPCRDEKLYRAGLIKGLALSSEQLEWMKDDLEQSKDNSVIIITHAPVDYKDIYPVVTLPDGSKVSEEGCSPKVFTEDLFRIGLTNRGEIIQLLRNYKNVKAVFSGHWHMNDVYEQDDIIYCQTCSLNEYPYEIRVVDIKNKCLNVTTSPLLSGRFAEESYMQDRGNNWVRGREKDRTFTLKL